MLLLYAGVGKQGGEIYHIKNHLEVADPSSDQCAWGSVIFEEAVLGIQYGSSASGFLLTLFVF
jgi:hypothetical protein